MSIKFQAAVHAADTAASFPSVNFLEKQIQGAPLLNPSRLNNAATHAPKSFAPKVALMGELMQNLPQAAPSIPIPTNEEGVVAKLVRLAQEKITEMTPQQQEDFFKAHPEEHPQHPKKVAASNGLELLYDATNAALLFTGASTLVGGTALWLKTRNLNNVRQGLGLTSSIRNAKSFSNAASEAAIESHVVSARTAVEKSKDHIAQIDIRSFNLTKRIYESAPQAKEPLLKQQAALHKELAAITEDVKRTTKKTIIEANKRYELISSNLRVEKGLVIRPLPEGVIKAKTQLLLETHHSNLVSAAKKGDFNAAHELRILQYTVGVTPHNVQQKQEQARAALKQLKTATDMPNLTLELEAVRSAITQLKNYRADIDTNSAISIFRSSL